jgi:hypothetical protein
MPPYNATVVPPVSTSLACVLAFLVPLGSRVFSNLPLR